MFVRSCLTISVLGTLVFVAAAIFTGCREEKKYKPTWESLEQHQTPVWFDDAKFGIFIHWGVYSVPAWAPRGEYAEWYPRRMYIKGNPSYEYHKKTYGDPSEFGYTNFIPMFKAEKWDPDRWAKIFKKAGARYVVPVAEHHDGFAMWDSDLTEWDAMDKGPKRDIIGELGEAVRNRDMKYAPSYHRARNWKWYEPTYGQNYETEDPQYAGIDGLYPEPHEPGVTQSKAFLDNWKKRWEEYRDKYKPDMLWFDDAWGCTSWSKDSAFLDRAKQIMADYYNKAQEWGKEVAINNKAWEERSDGLFPTEVGDYIGDDYRTPDTISPRKWSNPRGVGHSYGYNRNEPPENYDSVNELVDLLVDIVSKNGNLLLNIGPKADGTIPDIQKIAYWELVNG